jgi:8-oxo-dGTP pyrophosphatase MutT (NUDIX family)
MSDRKFARPKYRVEETSAGGFVLAADGTRRVALIGRLTRHGRLDWCVPKGHLEGEETAIEAAIREVGEETGLEVSVLESLGSIQYEFSAGPRIIAKTVHHYLFKQTGGDLTVEQDPDHEAVDVQWFHVDDLLETLAHENERRIARLVTQWVEANY